MAAAGRIHLEVLHQHLLPKVLTPHPRDCRHPLPSASPISTTLYPITPHRQLPNPSPSPHSCLQLHQLGLSVPSPALAPPGEDGVPSLGYFSVAQLRPRLRSWRDAERRLRRCGNPRRPSPGDRPGMLQRCSGGRARGTRAVGDVSIGMPPPYSPNHSLDLCHRVLEHPENSH